MIKPARLVGGVALTILFLWLAIRNVDIAGMRDALRHAHYGYLLPAVLCTATGYWLRTLRWERTLWPTKRIAFRRLFPVLMTGFATNNLLPARVGELVRAYLVGGREGISRSLVLATIVLERTCDGLMLIALMTVTLFLFPIPLTDQKLRLVQLSAMTIFGAATLILILLLVFPAPFLALTHLVLRSARWRLAARVEALLDSFIQGLQALRSPLALAQIVGLSLLVWLAEGVSYGFVMLAFPLGLERGEWPAAAVLLLVFVNLGIMIPSAPGYVGTYQFFATLALSAFHVPLALAISLSLVAHALQYSFITGVGLLCLWRLGLSPSSLGRLTPPAEPSPRLTPAEAVD